jgi:NDP-sugar pyrophosphorylase family protein
MRTALIFAAGLGTRLKPITNTTPKALIKIGNKPVLQIVIEKIKHAGFEKIVINSHHFAEQIFEFVQNNDFKIDITVSHEKEMLLDTGGGILFAQNLLGTKPFLVHNVDIISNVDLAQFYSDHNPEKLATLLVSNRKTSRYLLFNNESRLVGWQNTQTGEIKTPFKDLNIKHCNRLSFNGIHIISPKIFSLMQNEKTPFSIIDFYISICRNEEIIAHQQPKLQVFDVGTNEKLKEAENWLNKLS